MGISGNLTVSADIGGSSITAAAGTFTNELTVSGIPVSLSDVEGITSIVEDTTPQLGGNLDAQSFDISSVNSLTAVTGTFTEGLTVGTSTVNITPEGIIAPSGTFSEFIDITAGQITVASGSLSAPGLFIEGDLDTGIGSISEGSFSFIAGGSEVLRATGDAFLPFLQVTALFGSVAAPQYSFAFSPGTGLYQLGFSTTVGISSGGISALEIDESNRVVTVPSGLTVSGIPVSLSSTEGLADQFVAQSDGSLSAPAFTFASDSNSGMFWAGNNDLQFVQNGVTFLRFTAGRFIPAFAVYVDTAGTKTFPAYSWLDDRNTGLYQLSSGDDSIAFSTDDTLAGYFDFQQHLHVTNDVLSGGTVSGTEGLFDDGLTVSGVPVATGTVVDEGQIVFLAQMFG